MHEQTDRTEFKHYAIGPDIFAAKKTISADGRFEVDGGNNEGFIDVCIQGNIEGYTDGYSV